MGMNRVKRGSGWEHLLEIARIEGLDRAYTWNPAVGCNNLDCEVRKRDKCWAIMLAKRFGWDFTPHLVPSRLKEPFTVGTPSVIQIVSMGDLFGLNLVDTERILELVFECDRHIFAILTKMPQCGELLKYPQHVWFGVTVNSQKDVWRLNVLKTINAEKKYCLFEPLYSAIDYDLSWLDLIVIGPQNYPNIQPKREWVESVVNNAGFAHIFYKSSLRV